MKYADLGSETTKKKNITRNDKYLKAYKHRKKRGILGCARSSKPMSNNIKLRKDQPALKHQFVFTSSSSMIPSSLPTESSEDPLL